MIAIGDSWGGYRIVEQLGRGAMGVVFRARQVSLGREVALKVILPGEAMEEQVRRRFVREARAQANIDHPHVLTVYDMGEMHGRAFIAMKLVNGPTLKELISESLDDRRSLTILAHVAGALDAAHCQGVLHRDVKPGNILVDDATGAAYLADFGLARALEDSTLTLTGQLLGTPRYMPPEQFLGEACAASDIYSFAVVAYECFARDAYRRYSPLSVRRPDLPLGVHVAIERGVALDGKDRPACADELVEDVRTALKGRRSVAVRTGTLAATASRHSPAAAPRVDRSLRERAERNEPSRPPLSGTGVRTPMGPAGESAALGIAFVAIPPDEPIVEVAKDMISRRIFAAFLRSHPEWGPGHPPRDKIDRSYLAGWTSEPAVAYAGLPIVYISYHAATACFDWLSLEIGSRLRLPREEEWEVAAAAGRNGEWWQEDVEAAIVACAGRSGHRTPVGERGANPWGLSDLLGNVHDICVAPDGLAARGGSWRTGKSDLVRQRVRLAESDCRPDVGFRCVRECLPDLQSTSRKPPRPELGSASR